VLSYTNHPVQSLPELFVPLGDPPAPIHCRFVEPGDYRFRTTDHWETDDGRPVLKFGMEAVVPAKSLHSAPPRGTVVILHGYALNKTVMAPWGFFLAEQGYRCVLVDLRGHGRSGGRQIHFGPVESRDMTELLTGLARLGHITGPVGVLGDSYGAAIALRWAADDPRVRTVVAMAPYARLSTAMEGIRQTYARWVPATWVQAAAKDLPGLLAERGDALDTTSIAGRIRVPVLFVAGGRDVVAPVGDVRELQRSVVADSKVVVLDEAIHESLPYDFQRLGPVVREWFEERLR
jgi:pimeloyl-ACP methyl ester carboxylesterase